MIQISCKKCKQKFRREHGKAGPFLHSVSERLLPDSPHVYAFPICSTEFEVTFTVDEVREIKTGRKMKERESHTPAVPYGASREAAREGPVDRPGFPLVSAVCRPRVQRLYARRAYSRCGVVEPMGELA